MIWSKSPVRQMFDCRQIRLSGPRTVPPGLASSRAWPQPRPESVTRVFAPAAPGQNTESGSRAPNRTGATSPAGTTTTPTLALATQARVNSRPWQRQ